MKDRIKQIMDNEQLTPSAFADKLQLGRAVISHVLNGRNNPSLDVVSRILSKMDYINSDWLITGNGNMYKAGYENKITSSQHDDLFSNKKDEPDLFSQDTIFPSNATEEKEYRKEIGVKESSISDENTANKQVIYQKLPDRKISKIIIYYSDNTFETFNADTRPL